jgi:hypothetical protein
VVGIGKQCRIEVVLRIHIDPMRSWVACALSACWLLGCSNGKQGFVSVGAGKQHAGQGGGSAGKGSGGNGSAGKGSGGKAGSAGKAGSLDAGVGNGGAHIDAAGATMDAAVLGLDGSLQLPDGSLILQDGAIVLPDGEVIDVDAAVMRYTPEIDVASCSISESDTWSTTVDISDEGGFALVAGQTGFGLAYRGIGMDNCAQELELSHIAATSGLPSPHSVLSDCKRIADVTLLGTSDGWRLSWVDNFTETAELYSLKLDLDMNAIAGETRRQLTDDLAGLEKKPVLKEIDGQPFAAWITDDTTTDKLRITTQRLDGDAQPIEVVKADDGHHPNGLSLAQMGMKAAAVGWVGPAENPGVWLLKLDGNGAPVDAPIQLTDKVAVSSSIDLANRINGGGAIYSIELDGFPQVRYRRLDETGQPVADERVIVGPPLRAQGASLDTLGGGYAVAYRTLSGGDVTSPEVRLTFITKEGNTFTDASGHLVSFSIGAATLAEGRTYVSVSVEGEIMVAWIDADFASGKNLLKVVRRRLDCH